jgi:hypothetical protein
LKNATGDQVALDNWERYRYGLWRGHKEYVIQAAVNEGFYLGGGFQWDDHTRGLLGDRLAVEWNEIKPAVNTVIGYQIHNRMDIGFRPRGGDADEHGAEILNKVVKQVADRNKLAWKETSVLSDGCIEQRGYFDVRMDYNDNAMGEIRVSVRDPRDVIPDPDAKSYDPESWSDVTVTYWLTLDEIEWTYGPEARKEIEQSADYGEPDFGMDGYDGPRSHFGRFGLWGAWEYGLGEDQRHFRIVDRQKWEMKLTPCAIYPTGEVEVVDGMDPMKLHELAQQGCQFDKRMKKRVMWSASTWRTVLHDEVSPYPFITIVPFYPYFRRGQTRGIVDDGISPQKCLNLGVTQFIHILSTTANSGWKVQQNSLTNMTVDDLENWGGKTGLVIEYQEGAIPPDKITPNPIPTGVDRLIERATQATRDATVPEAMRGVRGSEQESGIAKQSDQFASQQQLAVVLDNLAITRHSLAEKILWLVQHYYTSERVFRITESDPVTGRETTQPLTVNQFDPASGGYLNDLTLGDYDVVITEQPMQVTFENSQYEQALAMRKEGINIPESVVIKHSNLSDKHDILQQLEGQQQGGQETAQAEAELQKAQAEKIKAETVQKRLESMYSALQTAQIIAQTPETSALGDTLLKSGGFQDQDQPPLLPTVAPGLPTVQIPSNTNPLTPHHADVGIDAGLETNKR